MNNDKRAPEVEVQELTLKAMNARIERLEKRLSNLRFTVFIQGILLAFLAFAWAWRFDHIGKTLIAIISKCI